MKKIIIFEVAGGSDKGLDGYRPDTMPIVQALKRKGQESEVLFVDMHRRKELFEYVKDNAIAYISRINPGNLKEEQAYFDMLRELSAEGIIGMPHPDAMIGYGAKDALVKLRNTSLVPSDTYAFYSIDEFTTEFPKHLALGERVLKQNRGSTGEGIWRVQLEDATQKHDEFVPLHAQVKCTEAKDNHVIILPLHEFMTRCHTYIEGHNGMLVDMPFLPRIKEGEIRLLMLRNKPVNVVHKKPKDAADAFSATLFSGATYRYDSPAEWTDLVANFLGELPTVTALLGGYDLPLIWTADFILDTKDDGSDAYILGEMNCSCVGFTSQLELAETIADEILDGIKLTL